MLGVLVAAGLPHSTGDWVRLVVVTGLWTLVVGGGAALAWAAVRTALSAKRGMERHGFGVCIGSDGKDTVVRDTDDPGPFTDWMHGQIQRIAAVEAQGNKGNERDTTTTHPLTFGDLKQADVNLQVMTTNLTLGRPQSFPFGDEQGGLRYLFDPEQLGEYFPPDVVDWLVECAPEQDIPQTESVADPHDEHRRRLRWLPKADELPIILAARLSLSFPGLISAVPLWALDKDGQARECWMSDGGLTANFPVHFFDSPLPGCPTFAIDLQHYPTEPPEHAADDVYYPAAECDPTPSFRGIKTMTEFGSALLTTMQYWSDTSQAALPGYRDRIVQVRLTTTEGGMNLQMPELRVLRVAVKGAQARSASLACPRTRHSKPASTSSATSGPGTSASCPGCRSWWARCPNGGTTPRALARRPATRRSCESTPRRRCRPAASPTSARRLVAPRRHRPHEPLAAVRRDRGRRRRGDQHVRHNRDRRQRLPTTGRLRRRPRTTDAQARTFAWRRTSESLSRCAEPATQSLMIRFSTGVWSTVPCRAEVVHHRRPRSVGLVVGRSGASGGCPNSSRSPGSMRTGTAPSMSWSTISM